MPSQLLDVAVVEAGAELGNQENGANKYPCQTSKCNANQIKAKTAGNDFCNKGPEIVFVSALRGDYCEW